MAGVKHPLLPDIPHELGGDRILLRCPRARDGAIICQTVRESLAELKPWMRWATDEYNEESAEEWCRKAAANFLSREQLQFLIFLREEGRHIGNVGAFKFNWEVPSCEVGYWLHSGHTNRGYMTEAVGILMKMLREHIHIRRVEIRSDAENLKSLRVAELAGFQLEGILRSDCIAVDGRVRNTCMFSSILNSSD